jgi:HD-GYP domain-containing protein (c-di-GMP phosphodiesterase class II)
LFQDFRRTVERPRRGADDLGVKGSNRSSGRAAWLATAGTLAAGTLLTLFGPFGDVAWRQPTVLFALVTISAAICIAGATFVIALADRREMAEIGLLGSALMAASVMPLVHGLVTPDVLYDNTSAFRTAAFLSLPIAVAVAAPLFRPQSSFGRWAARNWRNWTLLSLLGVFTIGGVVVFFPDAISVPGPRDPLSVVVSLAMVAAMATISLRQLRYFGIGRQPANLMASLSLLALSGTALLPLAADDYSPGFWWLHVAGALGVLGVCFGLVVSKSFNRSAQELLAPVLTRDPLVAFELGLSPVVHRFVASLDDKDALTRDHVVRTAELALRVGERFRLSPRELRDLGLAALLHDVGKLNIPDEILTKPASLTAEEYEVVKRHTVDGEDMLLAESTLASVAPIVRSHHERMDGRGYPDGLAGRDIPLASRIIAVCDALDAMTHDRQYRAGMPVKMAFAVLREHADSQWDRAVIDQVIAVLPSMPTIGGLDEVGRSAEVVETTATIPDDVSALLVAVDVEI